MKKKILLIFIMTALLTLITVLTGCSEDKAVPVLEITNPTKTKTSVSFEISETDPDGVGQISKIELWKDEACIKTAESVEVRKFTSLLPNTSYTVKVTYTYDLDNGEGEKSSILSCDIITGDSYTTKNGIKTDWSGKTLNIACSTWSSQPNAPWSVMELCVKEGEESGFGVKIDKAVLERQKYIKDIYGVELNWISATRWSMHDAIEAAILAGNINYDLALPRMMRAQQVVAGGYVYDLKDREYIDFTNTYYSKNSVEAYTAKGHTFFVSGDFTTLDKETAFVLYFNKAVLGGEQEAADLYQKVRDGKWTWSELVTLASAAYKDNGDGHYGMGDTYGLHINNYTRFFDHFGVKQAGVDKATEDWKITLNDPRVDDISSIVIQAQKSRWCSSVHLSEGWGTNGATDLKNQILLFYSGNLQFPFVGSYENIGVVPFPMLNEEQGSYYAPCSYPQVVLMCVPKITQDRNMSDYFLDVLAWTGNEYVMKAYIGQKAEQFTAKEDIEMITEYILPNILYDAGGTIGWGNLIGDVRRAAYDDFENKFAEAYAEKEPDALKTIAQWNTAWGGYNEN